MINNRVIANLEIEDNSGIRYFIWYEGETQDKILVQFGIYWKAFLVAPSVITQEIRLHFLLWKHRGIYNQDYYDDLIATLKRKEYIE